MGTTYDPPGDGNGQATVATDLQGLGFPTSTIAHPLNQSEGSSRVTPIYARHDFDKEKKTALEAWERHLDALLTGQPSRVVPFAGKRPWR